MDNGVIELTSSKSNEDAADVELEGSRFVSTHPDQDSLYFYSPIAKYDSRRHKISAEEAEKMGMIYKCVSLEDFEVTISKLALKLANMPTKALGLIKELYNKSMTNDLEAQLALESKLQIEAASTEDYAEGVAAFIEKRKPEFKGR